MFESDGKIPENAGKRFLKRRRDGKVWGDLFMKDDFRTFRVEKFKFFFVCIQKEILKLSESKFRCRDAKNLTVLIQNLC